MKSLYKKQSKNQQHASYHGKKLEKQWRSKDRQVLDKPLDEVV